MPGFDAYYWSPADMGLLAETFPIHENATGTILPTAGRIECFRLKVPQAGWCTNVDVSLSAVGATLTAGQNFGALFHRDGTLIAQTTDQSAAWVASTPVLKNMPLASGPVYLAVGEYYVGVWANGSTLPTFHRSTSFVAATLNRGAAAPNFRVCSANTGLTTTAPATLGTQTATAVSYYFSLS